MNEANPAQAALIAHIVGTLKDDARIHSAWLGGSFGRGVADAWSDVDVIVVVDAEDLAPSVAEYGGSRNPLGETVFLKVLYDRVVTAVTPDWRRYDLSFMTPQEFRSQTPDSVKPLIPGETPKPRPRPATAPRDGRAGRLPDLFNEFLRVLGLAPDMVGRGEWLVGQDGVTILRKLTLDLMLEMNQTAGPGFGGVKRLNERLLPAQRAALEALTPPRADRDALLAAQIELARLFFPLAIDAARQTGAPWPEAFAAATLRHLQSTLGLDPDRVTGQIPL